MLAKPKITNRRAAHVGATAKRRTIGDVAAVPRKRGRYGVEPYPKMVAAALRTIHRRDGAKAFEHVARLTLASVAIELFGKCGRAVLRDELKALGYIVR
jgi:hypothetical protein